MAQAVTNTWYITDDGKRFKNEAQANAHEGRAKYAPAIDAYLSQVNRGEVAERARKAMDARDRNTIVQFLSFQEALRAIAT